MDYQTDYDIDFYMDYTHLLCDNITFITMVRRKKKKTYPSQERYYENNPSVTFRVPKELKEKLEKLAEQEDKAVGQYVREYLEGMVTEREKEDKIYERGFNEGRNRGKEIWRIWFNCYICNLEFVIVPNSEEHEKIKRMRWICPICSGKFIK